MASGRKTGPQCCSSVTRKDYRPRHKELLPCPLNDRGPCWHSFCHPRMGAPMPQLLVGSPHVLLSPEPISLLTQITNSPPQARGRPLLHSTSHPVPRRSYLYVPSWGHDNLHYLESLPFIGPAHFTEFQDYISCWIIFRMQKSGAPAFQGQPSGM